MDVVQERLEQEFDLDIIMTAPSVDYHAIMPTGEVKLIDNANKVHKLELDAATGAVLSHREK